jgi:hypothetical protein
VTPLLYIAGAAVLLLVLKPGIASALVATVSKPLTGPELAEKYLGKKVGSIPAADLAVLQAYALRTYKDAELVDGSPVVAAATWDLSGKGFDWNGGPTNTHGFLAYGKSVLLVGVAGGQYEKSKDFFEKWNDPTATVQIAQMVRHHGKTLLQQAINLAAPLVGSLAGKAGNAFGLPI